MRILPAKTSMDEVLSDSEMYYLHMAMLRVLVNACPKMLNQMEIKTGHYEEKQDSLVTGFVYQDDGHFLVFERDELKTLGVTKIAQLLKRHFQKAIRNIYEA